MTQFLLLAITEHQKNNFKINKNIKTYIEFITILEYNEFNIKVRFKLK